MSNYFEKKAIGSTDLKNFYEAPVKFWRHCNINPNCKKNIQTCSMVKGTNLHAINLEKKSFTTKKDINSGNFQSVLFELGILEEARNVTAAKKILNDYYKSVPDIVYIDQKEKAFYSEAKNQFRNNSFIKRMFNRNCDVEKEYFYKYDRPIFSDITDIDSLTLRMKADIINKKEKYIIDYKTISDGNISKLKYALKSHFIQAYLYYYICKKNNININNFYFAFQNVDFPDEFQIIHVDKDMLENGIDFIENYLFLICDALNENNLEYFKSRSFEKDNNIWSFNNDISY